MSPSIKKRLPLNSRPVPQTRKMVLYKPLLPLPSTSSPPHKLKSLLSCKSTSLFWLCVMHTLNLLNHTSAILHLILPNISPHAVENPATRTQGNFSNRPPVTAQGRQNYLVLLKTRFKYTSNKIKNKN